MLRWASNLAVSCIVSLVCVGPSTAAGKTIGLSGLDLRAFRECAFAYPDWGDQLPEAARKHVLESRNSLVIIHDDDTWQTSSGSLELTPIVGNPGDFDAMEDAIADKDFRYMRCLMWIDSERPSPVSAPCDYKELLIYAASNLEGDELLAFNELIGASIARLRDPVQTRLLADGEVGGFAERALTQYVNQEALRQYSALNSKDLPEADRTIKRALLYEMFGHRNSIMAERKIKISPFRGTEGVIPLEVMRGLNVYLIPGDMTDVGLEDLELQTLERKLLRGEWHFVFSRAGSLDLSTITFDDQETIAALREIRGGGG